MTDLEILAESVKGLGDVSLSLHVMAAKENIDKARRDMADAAARLSVYENEIRRREAHD